MRPLVWVSDSKKRLLEFPYSELSDLLEGLFREFSITDLLSMLEKLNHEIEIIVHQRSANSFPTNADT